MSIIHETILKDITDIISDTKELLDDEKVFSNAKFKSITRNANDLVLVFPVLCTKSISIETASMITKAIEKNCVTLLQLLFASIQVVDTEDLQDYISRFHRNISIGNSMSVDDFLSFTNSISEAALEGKHIKIVDTDSYNEFKRCMSNIHNIAKTSLNENSLQDFTCHNKINGYDAILERSNNKNNVASQNRAHSELVKTLSDNDIKKANELMPTKVTVRFYYKNNNNQPSLIKDGLIGVKCKLYAVDSLEIIDKIAAKYSDTLWLKEFIRASTGEISFWRDFVFALDKAKVDALSTSRKGSTSKMWKVLERRATKNRLTKWKANRADSSPITTLVLNQDEVEYLKKDHNINLENRNVAMKLMNEYNFMGIVIVDEPSESASFIWDEGNNSTYETLSFRNLERESNDKDFRKVISLMTKVYR